MLANFIVAHVESNCKTCFGKLFDFAQDRLTTGGFGKRVVFSFEASLLLSLRAP